MGCDIHLYKEVKINGQWYYFGDANMRRNYELFSYMADVRNDRDITPIAKPRGLPSDVTFMTKLQSDRDGADGHSHSYVDAKEIFLIEQFLNKQEDQRRKNHPNSTHEYYYPEKQWGYLFGNGFGDFTLYPDDRQEGLEDIRFVFWFDN